MFERENAFYDAHQAEFQEKYHDKWLVIAGESLWGIYDTLKEATQNAMKHFQPGEFMLHTPAHDGMIIEIGPNISTRYPGDTKRPQPNITVTVSDGELATFTYA
jgi:hypothetical protein